MTMIQHLRNEIQRLTAAYEAAHAKGLEGQKQDLMAQIGRLKEQLEQAEVERGL